MYKEKSKIIEKLENEERMDEDSLRHGNDAEDDESTKKTKEEERTIRKENLINMKKLHTEGLKSLNSTIKEYINFISNSTLINELEKESLTDKISFLEVQIKHDMFNIDYES
jgi:hypothetical protein